MLRKAFERMLFLGMVLGCACVATPAQMPTSINGGILNGKAVDLPKPEYPEAARAARIGGVIGVNVIIDESGTAISVASEPNDQRDRHAPDGTKLDPLPADPTLRDAAEKAAWQARFSPTLLNGQPVKVKGKILYNFVVDNSDQPPRVGEINGPWLNGRALSIPKPEYPPEARAARIAGEVAVKILIGDDGSVTSAKAISGPAELRSAAEQAALKAKFRPTLVKGSPVEVAGVLSFNFVL